MRVDKIGLRFMVSEELERGVAKWAEAGQMLVVIGDPYRMGQNEWVPVVFDREEKPDWVLAESLDGYVRSEGGSR